jgi:hypothetical protein
MSVEATLFKEVEPTLFKEVEVTLFLRSIALSELFAMSSSSAPKLSTSPTDMSLAHTTCRMRVFQNLLPRL